MNARRSGRLFNLGLCGARTPIGDVVGHGVVEQHRVLRHDANGAAHAGLGHIAHILPPDADGAMAHIVKAVKQAGQRRLARARRADHGNGFPCGNFETDVVQDGARRVVGKGHAVKLHRRRLGPLQIGRLRPVGHLALFFQQGEHAVQIGQALFDFTVQHAQKIQGNVELDHEGVDHHQVTQGHAPVHHPLGGPPQHGHQGAGNDELLSRVQQAQRGLRLEPCAAQTVQAFVVAAGLKGLVVEVLDGFIVQQRVNRAGVGG